MSDPHARMNAQLDKGQSQLGLGQLWGFLSLKQQNEGCYIIDLA